MALDRDEINRRVKALKKREAKRKRSVQRADPKSRKATRQAVVKTSATTLRAIDARAVLIKSAHGRIDEVAKSMVDRAAAGDSRARKDLLALLPRQISSPIPLSRPLGDVELSDADTTQRVIAAVAQMVLAGRVGMGEGKDLVDMLGRVRDGYAVEELAKVREEIDQLRREAKGGSAVIDNGEVVPSWGRFREEQIEDAR